MFFIIGCSTPPPIKQPLISGKLDKACLPEAVEMCSSLVDHEITSQVIIFHTDLRNHAICVYLYPKDKPKIWGWDSYYGSWRLNAIWGDAVSESKSWLFYNGGTYEQFISAETIN